MSSLGDKAKMQHKYKQRGSNQTESSHLAKGKRRMRFLHLCGPYSLIALRWMLRYEQKLQLPDKAWLWPSQDKTDPPSSNVLHNGFSQELLTATARVLRALVLDCSLTSCYRSDADFLPVVRLHFQSQARRYHQGPRPQTEVWMPQTTAVTTTAASLN